MSSPPPPGKVITSAKTPPGASVRKEFHATGSLIPLLRSSGHSAHPATQLIGLLRPSHHSAHLTTGPFTVAVPVGTPGRPWRAAKLTGPVRTAIPREPLAARRRGARPAAGW